MKARSIIEEETRTVRDPRRPKFVIGKIVAVDQGNESWEGVVNDVLPGGNLKIYNVSTKQEVEVPSDKVYFSENQEYWDRTLKSLSDLEAKSALARNHHSKLHQSISITHPHLKNKVEDIGALVKSRHSKLQHLRFALELKKALQSIGIEDRDASSLLGPRDVEDTRLRKLWFRQMPECVTGVQTKDGHNHFFREPIRRPWLSGFMFSSKGDDKPIKRE